MKFYEKAFRIKRDMSFIKVCDIMGKPSYNQLYSQRPGQAYTRQVQWKMGADYVEAFFSHDDECKYVTLNYQNGQFVTSTTTYGLEIIIKAE